MKHSQIPLPAPFRFTRYRRAAVRKQLGSSAGAFLTEIAPHVGEYRAQRAAWNGPSPALVREAIENAAKCCSAAAAALSKLGPDACERIEAGYALNHGPVALPDNVVGKATMYLLIIARGSERATTLTEFNKGAGDVRDDALHLFIAKCAQAYKTATGKDPKPSSRSTFAKVMNIVRSAADGRRKTVSNDLLVKIIKNVR